MTPRTGKRSLPRSPHPDYLRKEAKTLLVRLRTQTPSLRLADVQQLLASEYGFAGWALLLAEVTRRKEAERFRRVAPSYFGRFGARTSLEPQGDANPAFLVAGAVTQIGFVCTAMAGLSLLFFTRGQAWDVHAAIALMTRHFL